MKFKRNKSIKKNTLVGLGSILTVLLNSGLANGTQLLNLDASNLALNNTDNVTSWGPTTASGTPTFLTGQSPNGNSAVEFNGNDHLGTLASTFFPASISKDFIVAAVVKANNIGRYHNIIDDDASNHPMLWIDPSFNYEQNFSGGTGSKRAGTGIEGWDVVIMNSRTNELYVNSATANATGRQANNYSTAEVFDLFNRDGRQTFQGLVAELRVYNDVQDFNNDFGALYTELHNKWFGIDLSAYSAISGAAISIAAQPAGTTTVNVDKHLAAQAAVSLGAWSVGQNVYAGAAVTAGASSTLMNLQAGAAVVTGANATVARIKAGAAITLGAGTYYDEVKAGAAVTFGAGAFDNSAETYETPQGVYISQEEYFSVDDMDSALEKITKKLDDDANQSDVLQQTWGIEQSGRVFECDLNDLSNNVLHFSAMNVEASSNITFSGDCKFTVLSSEAVTMGAQSRVQINGNTEVTWILGGALNVGAEAIFQGQAYVNGSITAATADVCGNLYATGAISVRSIGATSKCEQ
ncbi:MAG: hypothetical protein ACJASL_004729 [Paraglaciecola sp.]|jgi:hypothetical protein